PDRMVKHVTVVVVTLSLLAGGSGCGAAGGNSANSPVAPGNENNVTGGWTGTLTRPNGLAPLSLHWDAHVETQSNGVPVITGTMTITGASAAVSAIAATTVGGNDKIGYGVYLTFQETTPPSVCKVQGFPQGSVGVPYTAPYTSIDIPAFTISYVADCRGLFDGATQQTNVSETARVLLTKQ